MEKDGFWIILNEGWNADGMDYRCRTIHCGGDDRMASGSIPADEAAIREALS